MTKYPEFFDNDEFPWTHTLEKEFPTIKGEFDALKREDFASWPREHMFGDDWNLLLFFTPGRRFEEACNLCPETVKIVDSIPGIQMATYSWLPPQNHIAAHVGFSTTVLRSHLALQVPSDPNGDFGFRCGKTTRKWEEGKVMVFDDMHNHEAWNKTDEDRAVLMIDFLRPWRYRTSALGYIRHRVMPNGAYKGSYDRVIDEGAKDVEVVDPRTGLGAPQ